MKYQQHFHLSKNWKYLENMQAEVKNQTKRNYAHTEAQLPSS